MRLKESKDNWRASALLRKLATPPVEPKHQTSKKNTRAWCRGRVGTAHEYEFVEAWALAPHWYANYACLNCGKKEYLQVPVEIISAIEK